MGFCQRVFCLEGFVRSSFCPFPLLSEYICYNRKLNITLNFRFHMYDKKIISVTSQALDPSPQPSHKLSHLSRTPYPLERDVLYGRPLRFRFGNMLLQAQAWMSAFLLILAY